MIIATDLDDVLADLIAAFLSFHNKAYGTTLERKHLIHYDISKVLGVTQNEMNSRFDAFYASPEFQDIQPVYGAQQGINELVQNHRLAVVTSRPDSIANETRRWISRYFPNKFKDVCFTNYRGKRKACSDLGVDLLIEDCLEYALDCVTVSKILLIDEPWNQAESLLDRVERVKSWEEIVAKI